jgi:O-antigen ligase
VRARRRPPLLPPGWIVFALFAYYPLIWAAGIGGLVWGAASLPLLVWLLLRRDIRRPPTIALFILYVGFATFSVVRLDTFSRLAVFGIRHAVYVTAICLAYYVYNERRVTRTRFIDWVSLLWVYAIVGGYLGLLFPNFRLNNTPASLVLPESVASDPFLESLVRPRLAQVQELFGTQIPRPATLFSFTNEWGGNVGLLTPFFIAATIASTDPSRRRLGVIGLLVALPPMILSVNRGLWISLAAILVTVAVRGFIAGQTGAIKALGATVVVLAGLVVATPIGEVVSGRLSDSSTSTRSGIYAEAWRGALESPIIGWGGPRPSVNPFSPAVGTHGHLWFAMFSHGLIGLALFMAWLGLAIYRGWLHSDPVSILLTSVLVVALLQTVFYNFFPSPLPIILIAAGLLFRPDDRPGIAIVESATTRSRPAPRQTAGAGR